MAPDNGAGPTVREMEAQAAPLAFQGTAQWLSEQPWVKRALSRLPRRWRILRELDRW